MNIESEMKLIRKYLAFLTYACLFLLGMILGIIFILAR